jgi:hypothetical protein
MQDIVLPGNIRGPEVAIRTAVHAPNLPSTNQKFFFTTPDATFNAGDKLGHPGGHLAAAEDTGEFAYGGPNRLGTQSAYLNVPHTAQKMLTPLMLPHAKGDTYGNEAFQLPFPHLEKGDIAFHLRLEGDWELVRPTNRPGMPPSCRLPLSLVCKDWDQSMHRRRKRKLAGSDVGASAMMEEGSQVFVNLQTVNYILHGIQHHGGTEPSWRDSFWRGFGLDRLPDAVRNDAEMLCTHVVRWCMTPFGVVASDVSHSSDQAVAVVVDGRVQQVTNYWASLLGPSPPPASGGGGGGRHRGPHGGNSVLDGEDWRLPEAGDELILVLQRMEKLGGDYVQHGMEGELERWTHVLPRHMHTARGGSSMPVRMVFPITAPAVGGVDGDRHHIWQLVPSVAHSGSKLCWEGRGFWRIGTVH